ncbi:LytR family transcriptional regulator [Streptomyces armeniacus]|uniref:LytR family transcriptional regulator n=1 Tax=Streptomyces armeniacus TaxID=83291 RepID=A0A345Y1N7_9ACTN|nr:LytR family transcriptional regulator [Streptomyces armeniacus]
MRTHGAERAGPVRSVPGAGGRPDPYGPPWRGAEERSTPLRPPPRRPRSRRRKRRRPVRRLLLVLLAVLLATPLSTYAWAETRLNRDVDLGAYGHRPPPGEGTNYLIVGSDSREGLTPGQQKDLHTGGASGRRTDSMILLHTGASGTTMVSLPRDSWVTIPSYVRPSTGKRWGPAKNKLNAAFADGGPELLARTVEYNTGLRLDHYAEIGFAGFVNIVDSIGGVRMCLDRDIRDEKSGADLKKGCQTLDGTQSLAFVRQRHQEADGDLGRTLNQQKFLSALAHQAATADTVLNPATLYPALSAGLDTLVVDRGMGLRDLVSMVRAVQDVSGGKGKRINVPVSGVGIPTPKGSAVRWDEEKSRRLFERLRYDRPV